MSIIGITTVRMTANTPLPMKKAALFPPGSMASGASTMCWATGLRCLTLRCAIAHSVITSCWHAGFGFRILAASRFVELGPPPATCLPRELRGKKWTEAQAVFWQDVQIPDEGELTTEDEWRWFNHQAESAMRAATIRPKACGAHINDPPRRRVKGSLYEVQAHASGARGALEYQTFQLKGLLKLQGRLREWQRQLSLGRDTRAIQANVVRAWPRRLGDFHT